MNKTNYTLKKLYPGLPKDWEVEMEVGMGDYSSYYYRPVNGKYFNFAIEKPNIESFPEFWEPVVKKLQYPVGTVVENIIGEIYTKEEDGWNTKGWVEEEFEAMIGTRLRIVDRSKPLFKTDNGVDIFPGDKYYRIFFSKSTYFVEATANSREVPFCSFSTAERAQEYIDAFKPKVLFRTHDGCDIVDRNTDVYSCLKALTRIDQPIRYWAGYFEHGTRRHILIFASKDACQKYIDENRPIYSMKDLEGFYSMVMSVRSETLTKDLVYNCINSLKQNKSYEQ